jgi:hypothetical protein
VAFDEIGPVRTYDGENSEREMKELERPSVNKDSFADLIFNFPVTLHLLVDICALDSSSESDHGR